MRTTAVFAWFLCIQTWMLNLSLLLSTTQMKSGVKMILSLGFPGSPCHRTHMGAWMRKDLGPNPCRDMIARMSTTGFGLGGDFVTPARSDCHTGLIFSSAMEKSICGVFRSGNTPRTRTKCIMKCSIWSQGGTRIPFSSNFICTSCSISSGDIVEHQLEHVCVFCCDQLTRHMWMSCGDQLTCTSGSVAV